MDNTASNTLKQEEIGGNRNFIRAGPLNMKKIFNLKQKLHLGDAQTLLQEPIIGVYLFKRQTGLSTFFELGANLKNFKGILETMSHH